VVSLYAEDIPAGSHKVYVYLDGDYGDPIDTTCIFQPFREGALVTGAHGVINRRVIRAWVKYAKRHGYHKVYFSRCCGTRFTRFARYAFTEGGLHYYRIDLCR